MIRKYVSICAMVLFIVMIGKVGAEEAKKDIPISYEMPVFVSDKEPQKPGTHLNAPGDTYSYTFIIDDKHSSNPNLYIKNAILGVHIIDDDWSREKGDGAQEWGRILINGKPMKWINLPFLKKMGYRVGQTPSSSELYEFEDDNEVCKKAPIPPYIFNVTDIAEKDRKVNIEITNVRKNGKIEGDAPYGDFNVLRVGFRVTWAHK